MKEPQQVTTKELQQVTTKNPKRVEVGRRLAASNHKKREELKAKSEARSRGPWAPIFGVSQYYSIGAVIAIGVIGGLGYYIYQTKKGQASGESPLLLSNRQMDYTLSLTSSKWIKSILTV